jgi:hypothetical protein
MERRIEIGLKGRFVGVAAFIIAAPDPAERRAFAAGYTQFLGEGIRRADIVKLEQIGRGAVHVQRLINPIVDIGRDRS